MAEPQTYKASGAFSIVLALLWLNLVLWGLYGVIQALGRLV